VVYLERWLSATVGFTMMNIQYDDIAENYARFRESDSDVVEKLILKSCINGTSKILEIGCRTGNYVAELKRRVRCSCWGVDSSPEMIRRAKAHSENVTFSVGLAEDLGFDEDFFDFAFSVDVIHHVVNRAGYFTEAYRVLKSHGLLATVTDFEDTIKRRKPLAFYFPETIEHELKRYPTVKHLRSLAEEASFKIFADEIAETPFKLNCVEKYEKKAFSCLRLISEDALTAGIARMRQDLELGPISCVSRNHIFWSEKPANQSVEQTA
jgi:ubiquinone/menaquinone biosynthesis C-methylase UbiE